LAEKRRHQLGLFGGSKKTNVRATPAPVPTPWTPTVDLADARRLLLDLIHETHRQRPLENNEALALLGRFQEAGGVPVDPHRMAAFMRAEDIHTYPERPWLWLAANARIANANGDDELVAYAVFWAGVWNKQFHARFREFLTRAMLMIGGVPRAVRSELQQLGATALARLPQDQVLFGDNTGQVTVGWLRDELDSLLA
jgi:hypothetical protein